MSDGGSSTTSGHWSGGSGISTPSPPHSEASPKYSNEAFSSPRADDGFETDSDPLLFDEPAPRKRKVWNLGKELSNDVMLCERHFPPLVSCRKEIVYLSLFINERNVPH